MSNRTTVRGTAMTAIGWSAPRLATAAVERTVALRCIDRHHRHGLAVRRADERGSAVPRGFPRRIRWWSQPRHERAARHIRRGHCGPAGLWTPARRRVESEGRRSGRPQPLEISRTIAAARACGSGREIPQPHSASSSSVSIIGNDLCRTRKSCAGQRGPDDHEGMTTHPEYTLTKPSTCLNNRDDFSGGSGSGATLEAMMQTRRRRGVLALHGVILAFGLTACGDDGGSPAGPSATTAQIAGSWTGTLTFLREDGWQCGRNIDPNPENSWRVPIPVQTQEPPCGTSAVLTTTCATTEALA